jgi:hypothetical protein
MQSDDLNFYRGKGHRVPLTFTGPQYTNPFLSDGVRGFYDPSEVAAAWRLIDRIRDNNVYTLVCVDLATIDVDFKHSSQERHENMVKRFKHQLDYRNDNQELDHSHRINLGMSINSAAPRQHLRDLISYLNADAALFGIDAKVLRSVVCADIIDMAGGVSAPCQNWLMKKMGVKKLIKVPPTSWIAAPKKKGKRKRSGTGRRRKSKKMKYHK